MTVSMNTIKCHSSMECVKDAYMQAKQGFLLKQKKVHT